MTKISKSRLALVLFLFALDACLPRVSQAADPKPMVFPPLEIFHDLCTNAGWALEAVAQLAQQRKFTQISSEGVPTPDGGSARKIIWQAETAVGPIGIIVVAGESKTHEYTEVCSVTSPAQYTDFIQSWLRNSFGEPASTSNNAQNGTQTHWRQAFGDGKIEVILDTKAPDEKSDLLSIMKHKKLPTAP